MEKTNLPYYLPVGSSMQYMQLIYKKDCKNAFLPTLLQ